MTQKSEFDRLEQFVKRLLAMFDQLRRENSRLENRLAEKEVEVVELKEELLSADSDRGDITNRVRGLIRQIEEWEAQVEDPEIKATESETPIEVNEEEEEKDIGHQQNLFNVERRNTDLDG